MSDQEEATTPKFYWVKCSDGGYVSMNSERLEFLLDLMPTLRFLLLGHPLMKPKELQQLPDGNTQILEIPVDFRISQKAFLQLINCILEADPLPPRRGHKKQGADDDSLTVLTQTMATLGGCKVLEQRLKDHHGNPLTPEEDTNNDYEWHILRISKTADIRMDTLTTFANAGYNYTTSILDPLGGGIMATHLYRKKRK